MKIYMYDGSCADASEIEFGEKVLILDGYRIVPLIEVLRIIG